MAGEIEAYIRQAALRYGIDPDIAVRVAKSEGGLTDPVRQSQVVSRGRQEPSFGPFQLLIGGNGFPEGLGNRALAAGIDPRDPNQWQQGVDFALAEAARKGWGQWYGAANTGIGKWQGIGAKSDQAQQYNLPPVDPLGKFNTPNPAAAGQPPGALAGIGSPETYETTPPASAPAGGLPGPVGHPPNPTVGTGDLAPTEAEAEEKPKSIWEKLGTSIGAGAKAMGKAGKFSYDVPAVPGPARVDVGAAPFVDPQGAEMKRQQLAAIMARLNQGTLF